MIADTSACATPNGAGTDVTAEPGPPAPVTTVYHGRHTAGLLVKVLVVQSRGVAVCMWTGDAGGDGVTYPEVEEAVDRAGLGGLAGGVSEEAAARCMSLRRCPKCVINWVPSLTSTPGMEAKQRDTSLAACVNPARKRSASTVGFSDKRRWRRSLWRWRTVNSKISAFSNLATFSPSDWRALTINSLSSSRQRLMRARLLRSSIGFITLRYW